MSKLFITELMSLPVDAKGNVMPIPDAASIIGTQVVDFSSGAAASAAFNSATKFIRVVADAACSIKFGSAPTATTSDMRLPADAIEHWGVGPTAPKLSAIAQS